MGDGITFASHIEKLAGEYDDVVLDTTRLFKIQQDLLGGIDNVVLYHSSSSYDLTDADITRIQLCWDSFIGQDHWRKMPSGYLRDEDKEQDILDFYVGKYGEDFILTHHRPLDNGGSRLRRLDYDLIDNPSKFPVINLDFDAIVKEGDLDLGILNFRKLIEKAHQIHVYEGSFCCLSDTVLEGSDKLYWHGYVKPYVWDKNKQPHHKILKYINDGDWHKNSWTYYGLDKKEL
jgi:hypothetical protein